MTDQPNTETNEAGDEPKTEAPKKERNLPELVTTHRDEVGFVAPRNLDEALRFASGIVQAGLAPDSYNNNPSQVLLGVLAAMEAGLPPLTGLRNIAIIGGRPTMWGDSLVALVQAKNLIEDYRVMDIGESFDPTLDKAQWPDSYGVQVRIVRRNQETPYIGEFSVGMAKKAGLWGKKGPWQSYPKRMLTMRARGFALRDGFADALGGIAIREEMEDVHGAPKPDIQPLQLDDEPVTAETLAAQEAASMPDFDAEQAPEPQQDQGLFNDPEQENT